MKFNSFSDLLEYTSLWGVDLLGRDSSEVLLHIPGVLELPLEPRRGSSQRVIRIRSNSKKGELAAGVLWDCLFGAPRLKHWLVLFECINRCDKYSSLLQCLFDVMMIINKGCPSGRSLETILDTKMTSVSREFGVEYADKLAKQFRSLGVSIPIKKPALKLVTTSEIKHFRKSPDVRRIGVGYKDKGSLGLPGSEYDPYEIPASRVDPHYLWSKLLERYHSKYS